MPTSEATRVQALEAPGFEGRGLRVESANKRAVLFTGGCATNHVRMPT